MKEIRTTQANPLPNFIDFGIGQPGLDLLPLDFVRRAAAIRLGNGDPSLLNYGYELGDGYFRLALARFLEGHYGTGVSADTLMVTAGASQALDLICTRFTRPGDVVFVEKPTYFLALRIFADHNLQVEGLPTDDEGMVMEALAAALQKQKPTLLYTVPTFQNPAGVTMSAERRQQLADLSGEYHFLVVADEVYHLLAYEKRPPRPMASFNDCEHVLSLGSFSKILAPGLRLGWIQGSPERLQVLASSGLVDSGGGLNPFTSNLVRIILESGWQENHLARLKTAYQRRLAVMDKALAHYLVDRATYRKPDGGFFFWLSLPAGVDTVALHAAAKSHQVGFQPGVKFSHQKYLQNYMRLSFAYYEEEAIARGIERLRDAVAAFVDWY